MERAAVAVSRPPKIASTGRDHARDRDVEERSGAGSVIEAGAIVCDYSALGAGCVVRPGAVVKQRSGFGSGAEIDGFPAVEIGRVPGLPQVPAWAGQPGDDSLPTERDPR